MNLSSVPSAWRRYTVYAEAPRTLTVEDRRLMSVVKKDGDQESRASPEETRENSGLD